MSTTNPDIPGSPLRRGDGLAMGRWFLIYGLWLIGLAIPAWLLLRNLPGAWQELFVHPGRFTEPGQQAAKLLVFALYLSVCTTFTPLPTTWLVAGLATRDVALAEGLGWTVLLVSATSALASSMANTTDYHCIAWALRHHKIAQVRQTRLYRRLADWFFRRPFALLVIFNVVPVPVDIARMLAAGGRYPLAEFFAANFIGRFIRAAVMATATYELASHGKYVPAALLGLAVVLAVGKVTWSRLGRRRGPSGADGGGGDAGRVG